MQKKVSGKGISRFVAWVARFLWLYLLFSAHHMRQLLIILLVINDFFWRNSHFFFAACLKDHMSKGNVKYILLKINEFNLLYLYCDLYHRITLLLYIFCERSIYL